MDRRDRDRYNRNEPGLDYGRYEGYSRNDDHYHSAKNLTDQFEREYRRDRGYQGDDYDRRPHTYHEGSMGDAYEQRRREGRGYGNYSDDQWSDRDRNRNYGDSFRSDRDRYSNNQYDDRGDRDWDRNNRYQSQEYGNTRQGYGNAGGYSPYNMDDYTSGRGGVQGNYTGSRNDYGSSHDRGRNYGRDNDQGGSYGVRGGSWFSRERDDSGDNWRAKHRLRSDF